ncbi:MAG: hypothetical protein EXQ69_09545 [Acidimicrobiia bacterium]|nr:hypothetical protein [Acidimicrobiia bacterium]
MLQRCAQCARLRFYPRALCPYCYSHEASWQPVAGKGFVYAATVVHRPPSPAFAADVPYVVAIIELDEGPRMMSNVVGCTPESVVVGMLVEVVFDVVSPEITLPRFRPTTASS